MGADVDFLGQLGPELVAVLPRLDERSRRLVAGMAARAAGDGGTAAVAALAKMAPQTVAKGAAELASGEDLPPGRVRRPGGGRKRLTGSDPGLAGVLESLVRDAIRGDPESPLIWTTRSAEHLAGELTRQGHPCSDSTVLRMLGGLGYTQQSNSRAQEGRRHPERDGQFRHIAARSREYLAAGDPVISVDSKKKEQAGNYAQPGREWAPAGQPVTVRSHDFPDRDQGHAIPYGIYDEQVNAGFVNVGTDGNTAALAVESVRRWWRAVGRDAYPGAARLLLTCDAGGSNGYKNRAWKAGLAALAAETGLDIEVCHFPPGTSKWNKIEHRLFCQISLAWRGRPLTSYDVIIDTISHVTSKTGLTALAVLDDNAYPTGTRISGKQDKDIEDRCLTRRHWHGERNCTLLAVPRPAPEPEPGPAALPRLCGQDQLNHPALTGMDPADPDALAAALDICFRAWREQHLHAKRGRGRIRAAGAGGPRKIDITGHLIALRLRQHLNLPAGVAAALLAIKPNTVSKATGLTARLLAALPAGQQPAPAPPPGIPLRTLHDLREYAARHGITISSPPTPDTASDATLTTPAHHSKTLF